VLVAHDRWFLEAVGTSVLELEGGRGRFFSGTWHQWRKEKAAQELALGRSIERQQAEIDRLERFVTRFRAGTRAKQAQSRAKKLAKIDRIGRDPADGAALAFSFAAPERSGRVVIELEHATLSAGNKELLHDSELWLERGEHVSLVGANGTGKTTLIETLAGKRELPAPPTKLRIGHNVQVGYLSQHAEELAAGGARTVIEAAQRLTGLKPGPTRALLGRFLFSGEDAEKPLEGLSGGERRRLSLAILVNSGANLLILDEPTNHLDLESREALEEALHGYPGSLLLISHDRALLDAIGSRTIELYEQDLHSYVGGWPEYLRVRGEREAKPASRKREAAVAMAAAPTAVPAKAKRAAKTGPKPAGGGRGRNGGGANGAKRLESEIEAAEAALRAVEDELSESAAWASPEASARSTERHEAAKQLVSELYERYEAVAG
jgi:ATP-binding cassette subfamily F protein 3